MKQTQPLLILFLCFFLSLTAQVDITIYDESIDDNNLTFLSTLSNESYLINRCGEIVKQWNHTGEAGLSGRLTHDGQLLRAQEAIGCCPQASTGGLLELYDYDQNINWSYKFADSRYTQHHDFHYMDNGNILFIGWEVLTRQEKIDLGKSNEFEELWSEFVYEIKPIGTDDYELVWEWHLSDHLVQGTNPAKDNYVKIDTALGKIDINYRGPVIFSSRDWWHVNAIHYNKERDEILLGCRSNGEMWIIDHSTTSEEAKGNTGGNRNKGGQILFRWGNPRSYQRGTIQDLKLYGPHGHHWIDEGLPNAGKILFFNNGDGRPEGYYSTVEMVSPKLDSDGNYVVKDFMYELDSHEVVYGDDPNVGQLISQYLSNAQQLKNGNFLINEGGEGRVFEINESSEIVWEMQLTDFGQSRRIFRAYSHDLKFSGFSNLDSSLDRPQISTSTGAYICSRLTADVDNLIEWSTGETSYTIIATTPGEYFFTSTNCQDEIVQSQILVVDSQNTSAAAVKIKTPDGTEVCNSVVRLIADEPTAEWSTGQVGAMIFAGEPGEYYYSYENCVDAAVNSDTVVVTGIQAPIAQTISVSVGEDVLLEVAGTNVLWFESEDDFLFLEIGNTFFVENVQENMTLWVVAANFNFGCFSERVPINIVVDGTSLEDTNREEGIVVTPNPASDYITFKKEKDLHIKSVRATNSYGYSRYLLSKDGHFSLRDIPSGIYYLQVETEKRMFVEKIVVLK